MRICVDVQSAVAQRAGVGRYTKLLVQHLGAEAQGDELRLFYFDFRRQGPPFEAPGAAFLPFRLAPGRWIQGAWRYASWPPFDLCAGPADVYHFPNFLLPPLRRGQAVVTIHDLGFLRCPAWAEDRNCRHLTARIQDTVRRAAAVIAVSDFTAAEIPALLPVDPARVFAVPSGIEPLFRPPPPDRVRELRARLGLDRPYLLTVGTIEPRKNLPFLAEVFERLADFDGELVIAGSIGWKAEPILERLRASPRAAAIRCLGYVSDADLPALYAGADAFLCASFYEGFGFPPLEAMACGTPVLSSTGGALAETLAGGAELLAAFDADLWAERLRRLLGDAQERAQRTAAGQRCAARYRWEETARRTWEVYRRLS